MMWPAPYDLAMFPLGTVLVPGVELPLHVFEPRYRELVRDCLAGTPEFGVVLIERGSEVGGGDVRFDSGCVARIVSANELPDGRWILGTAGVRRIRIVEWLPDDPYPRAKVEDWPDETGGDESDLTQRLRAVESLLRRVLALASEVGLAVPPATVTLAAEPDLASYQLSALAPIGPLDRLRLLEATGVVARLDTLVTLLEEQQTLLARQLEG